MAARSSVPSAQDVLELWKQNKTCSRRRVLMPEAASAIAGIVQTTLEHMIRPVDRNKAAAYDIVLLMLNWNMPPESLKDVMKRASPDRSVIKCPAAAKLLPSTTSTRDSSRIMRGLVETLVNDVAERSQAVAESKRPEGRRIIQSDVLDVEAVEDHSCGLQKPPSSGRQQQQQQQQQRPW